MTKSRTGTITLEGDDFWEFSSEDWDDIVILGHPKIFNNFCPGRPRPRHIPDLESSLPRTSFRTAEA